MKRRPYIIFIIPLLVLGASCRSAKKIQQAAVPKVDSTEKVTPAAPIVHVMTKADSLVWGNHILDSTTAALPQFNTFYGKLGVSYQSTALNQDVNASVRIKKDQLIWISLTGPFGIEGARILIKKDSVILMNKLNRSVEHHSIAFLEKMLHIPLSFEDFQNLLIGGPILSHGKTTDLNFAENNTAFISLLVGNIQNNIRINEKTKRVLSNSLAEQTGNNNRSCTVKYGDFDNSSIPNFAKSRKIEVQGPAKASINLQYKEYEMNKEIDFPFNIPSSYIIK